MGGDLVAIGRDGSHEVIGFDPPVEFKSPSDIKLLALADGSSVVAVPEQEAGAAEAWRQRVRMVRLPAGF
jgi:hypothetical protein